MPFYFNFNFNTIPAQLLINVIVSLIFTMYNGLMMS